MIVTITSDLVSVGKKLNNNNDDDNDNSKYFKHFVSN